MLPGPYGNYGRVFIVRTSGTDLRQVTPDVPPTAYAWDNGGNWSPDGKRMVFARSGQVYLIHPNGKDMTNIHPGGPTVLCQGTPAWSPKGNKIACAMSGIPGHVTMDIVTFNVDGSGLTALTNSVDQTNDPRWAPTGTHLLFSRYIGGHFQIFRINADGSHDTRISQNSNDEYGADWSPIVR